MVGFFNSSGKRSLWEVQAARSQITRYSVQYLSIMLPQLRRGGNDPRGIFGQLDRAVHHFHASRNRMGNIHDHLPGTRDMGIGYDLVHRVYRRTWNAVGKEKLDDLLHGPAAGPFRYDLVEFPVRGYPVSVLPEPFHIEKISPADRLAEPGPDGVVSHGNDNPAIPGTEGVIGIDELVTISDPLGNPLFYQVYLYQGFHRAPGLYNQTVDICTAAGVGVSILPRSIQLLHREGVVYRKLDHAPVLAEVDAIWKEATKTAITDNFLSLAGEIAGNFI